MDNNLKEAKDKISSIAERNGVNPERLQEKFENAGATVREWYDSAKVETHNLEDKIKNRPFTSAAIAFGVGLVTAMLLRNNRA